MKDTPALFLNIILGACILMGLDIVAAFFNRTAAPNLLSGSLLGWLFLSSLLATAALVAVILGARTKGRAWPLPFSSSFLLCGT